MGVRRSSPDDRWSLGIKKLKLQHLLRVVDELKIEQCMIFVRTQLDCDNLSAFLTKRGGGGKFLAGFE